MSATQIEDGFRVAVLIPCRNQAATIGAVVRGFREALPAARIYVFDNNSTDDTARAAAREGAHVYRESRPGKGGVVRRMFADVEADIYVLADGDGSYDPADAPSLVNTLVTEHVDMAIGTRSGPATGGYPVPGGAGRTFEWLYRRSFPTFSFDIASGYRAFTRRFVKSFPAIPSGFDIGTELSMHASQLMIPVAEIALSDAAGTTDTTSGPRFRIADALRAVANVAILLKETRPFALLSVLAILFWSAGLLLVAPAFAAGLAGNLGFLSHAVLGMALFVAGFVLAGCGLILEAVGRARIEQKRILFLAVPGLRAQ